MDYKVLKALVLTQKGRIEKMETEVNELITRGWKPVGGLAIGDGAIFQAMVKDRRGKV